MRTVRPALLGCLSAVLVAACAAGTTTTAPKGSTQYPQQPPAGNPVISATVSVANFSFSPASVSLAAGGTVTWSWQDSGHSVTSDGSPSFAPNAPISAAGSTLGPVVFAAAGTYQYYCMVHGSPGGYGGGMLGSIFVQ